MQFSPLPIDTALPELTAALRTGATAVLVAPPGAGKTTRVPLVLADESWAANRRILVLEPRRLAARAAAGRMAKTLGEKVGETVGLRVRFGSKVSRKTRIEIVTEGIFTRLVIDDPMLDGVAAVLFDEFHERSLDADLGLALARDVQHGLRENLRLLVMSATRVRSSSKWPTPSCAPCAPIQARCWHFCRALEKFAEPRLRSRAGSIPRLM
jgi:ATP-dependent helicase HrpB